MWLKGTESKQAQIVCDRVKLTGMLASRDHQKLLMHFLSALEASSANCEELSSLSQFEIEKPFAIKIMEEKPLEIVDLG